MVDVKQNNSDLPNVVDALGRETRYRDYRKLLADLNNLVNGTAALVDLFVNGDTRLDYITQKALKRAGAWLDPVEAERLENLFYTIRSTIFAETIDYELLEKHFEALSDD